MRIRVGDKVMCSTGVEGVVIKIFTPAGREKQIAVNTQDGRVYYAPVVMWTRDYVNFED